MISLGRRFSTLLLFGLTIPACVIGELPAPIDESAASGGAGGLSGAGGAFAGRAGAEGVPGGAGTGGKGEAGASAGQGGASAGQAGASAAAGEGGASAGQAGASAGQGGASAGQAGASAEGGAAGAAGDPSGGGAAGAAGNSGGGGGASAGAGGIAGASGQGGAGGKSGAGAGGAAGALGGTGGAGGAVGGSAGAGGGAGGASGGPTCLPSMVSSLVHWWHLDEDVVFTNSPFQQGTPPREVPDAMGRRFAWRGQDSSYSVNAAVPGLFLPEKDPATNLAGAFVIPIGAKPLPALKSAFTLEWKMAFPAFGGQYLFYQVPAAGRSSLTCSLGGSDVIGCDLNGTKVGFKIDPAAYTGQHAWALAYDRDAQTVSLSFDGQPVPIVAGSLVPDWNARLDATEDLAFLGTGKTIAEVRLWDRALTPSEIANEVAKGSCSVVDPLRFNFKGDPGWTPGNPRPTTLYPADVAESGFQGFGQPPPSAQAGQGGDAFLFTHLSPTNMAWLAITTPRTFRVDHVTSYHDANLVKTPFTLVAEVSAQGETEVTSGSGWRKLYARQPVPSGESVNENVASPPSLTAGTYMVRFRPEIAPDPSTTQVSTAWFFMVGTRMP